MTDPVVAQGAVLPGKYRVERVLGQGGMGVVVQATHLQLGQPVAMKFLRPGCDGAQPFSIPKIRIFSSRISTLVVQDVLNNGAIHG